MIGDPINRIDGRLKVTGSAKFSAEIPIDHVAYGVIVQSTIAKGTIEHLDIKEATAAPGVIAVITADNVQQLPDKGRVPPPGRVLTLLQERTVRYNGEPIAVVVAESFEEATHAATLVRATYRAEPPVIDMHASLPGARPYTQKILGSIEPTMKRGDVNAGLAQADAHVDAIYTTPIETHNAMEPHGTIARWDGEHLTLYDSTQYVYGVKRSVAKALGIPDANVRVISNFTGGAFGSKGTAWSQVVLSAMAAKHVNRPVKLVLSRRHMFGIVGARPYTVQHLELGARKDGSLTAIRHASTSSTSALEDWLEPSTLQTRMLYACPNAETSQKLVTLNVGTPTFNRAPGESSGTFALESALDELAVALAMDPIELRLKNHADADPESGKPWSSKSLRECYARGAEKFGWSKRTAAPRSMKDGDILIGYGMASATYPTRRSPAAAVARMMPNGDVVIQAATHELGTGTYTVMSQIAAEVLGIPVERVRFELGDSDMPENPISAGSMTAASTGSAVHAAATALKEKLGTRVGNEMVEARAESKPGEETKIYSMHAFGAVFAEVRVDQMLGQIRTSRLVCAYGAGRILNAKTARSQMIGGVIYGLGMALTEDTLIDPKTGRYVNADLGEYHLPVNADVPDIDVIFIDEKDEHVNPIGVKGVGEIGITGVAAAIANAVFHATGVRVRDLPITLDKILRA
ncbi:MAG: xanthine dehydrogenase family protein molybdopterin-binding subunit [Gemmatimonadota bacterium]|nr:xanthine dehydrogenase family protein molybdopterin-binding subunit [Gemmatimonadota bacterium]